MTTSKRSPASIIFFLFITACIVAMFLLPNDGYSEKEKRYLEEFPTVTLSGILDGSVQTDFEDWFADSFPFRDFWVGLNAYWKLSEGRNAQQEVYHADDGYLLNAPETLDTERFTQTLERFDSFADSTGLPASMIIVPSSGWLNQEKLPAGHGEYHDTALFELAADTLHTVTLCDLRDSLLAADTEQNVCYRTDHHLTAWGNYTLYRQWCTLRGLVPLDTEAFTVTSYDGFYGTTWSASGYWLTAPDTIEVWDSGLSPTVTITDSSTDQTVADSLFFPEHLNELDKYPIYLDGNHALEKIENPNADGGTILLIKDSYAHCFATFLANQYQTIYLLDLRYYRGSVSDFVRENGVEELLYLYGVDTLLTDSNSGWLM